MMITFALKKILPLCAAALALALAGCAPAQKETTLYDFKAKAQNGREVPLRKYKGKVVLVVNTASECGFTPQYADLERMYERFRDRGFEILDFPCNQFGAQSPESDAETTRFCQENYGTQFPQYSKIEVNGENQTPLYAWLKSRKGFEGFDKSDPRGAMLHEILSRQNHYYDAVPDIKWNFTKFLIDRRGRVVARFEPTADMAEVEAAIVALLP